jgi:hypothetical protein
MPGGCVLQTAEAGVFARLNPESQNRENHCIARVFLSHMLIAPSQPDNLFRTMKLSYPSSATCHHS